MTKEPKEVLEALMMIILDSAYILKLFSAFQLWTFISSNISFFLMCKYVILSNAVLWSSSSKCGIRVYSKERKFRCWIFYWLFHQFRKKQNSNWSQEGTWIHMTHRHEWTWLIEMHRWWWRAMTASDKSTVRSDTSVTGERKSSMWCWVMELRRQMSVGWRPDTEV